MAAMSFDKHLRRFFPDGEHEDVAPARAGIEDVLPGFRVRRIAPDDPAEPWIYVTNGAAQAARPARTAPSTCSPRRPRTPCSSRCSRRWRASTPIRSGGSASAA